jgi:hypothetical protein
MILCKDCKWCKPDRGWIPWSRLKWEYAKCLKVAPDRRPPSSVDGHAPNPKLQYCDIVRQFGPCGPDAKLFEPKEESC